MVNQQTLQGNWNEWKGKLKQKWGQLSNDDLQSFSGNVDQLVGLIQRKTGEARSAIESYFDELSENGGASLSQAAETVRKYANDGAETVRNYANQAAEQVQDATRRTADQMRRGAEEATEMIRQRPGESAAVCFGAGMVLGVVVGLILRR